MGEERQISRRNFLSLATWAIGGLISVGIGLPAIVYIVAPLLKRDETQDWIRIGTATKVELGTPALFKVKVQRQTGWVVSEEELAVYLLTDNGRDFIAMSSICTHLGCRVRWISDQEQFFCPCHNATFDKSGNVLTGPPPRPLDRYEVKIQDGQLYVLGG